MRSEFHPGRLVAGLVLMTTAVVYFGDAGGAWEMVVAVVGDGDFLFGQPSTAFWMARRYMTVRVCVPHAERGRSRLGSHSQPFLTVVLNNGGWNVGALVLCVRMRHC